MPRPRTSTKPPLERAKLRTVEEINLEIRKLYRRHANKMLSAAEFKSRIGGLVALRSGMADPIEQPTDFVHPGFNIVPVVSGTFMTPEACEHLKATRQLPEGAVITLIEPTDETEPSKVVPLRQLSKSTNPAPIGFSEADLKNMSMREITNLVADRLGVSREDIEGMTTAELAARLGASPD